MTEMAYWLVFQDVLESTEIVFIFLYEWVLSPVFLDRMHIMEHQSTQSILPRMPGGSSNGSGVVVAAKLVDFSLGEWHLY